MTKTKDQTFTLTVEGKKCIVKEPGFQELQFALTAMTTTSGRMDMVGAGKAIFDTCKVECDKAIEESPKLLVSLCLEIANQFLDTVEVEIKKN